MKRISSLILSLLICLTGCASQEITYTPFAKATIDPQAIIDQQAQYSVDSSFASEAWYDMHEVYSINELDHRANFHSYNSVENALSITQSSLDDIDQSYNPLILSLDGSWKMYYADKPTNRLRGYTGNDISTYTENWDVENFDDVTLPSTLQTIKNEDGSFKYESPIYVNNTYPWLNFEPIQYGWDGNPVAATAFNSVTHYKRFFVLDSTQFNQGKILLHFEGISSAFYVYINGQCIGYSEDSYTDSYFDISDFVVEGENSIALEVYRFCDGSYLENQDMIRLSGVFRSISLEFVGDQFIYDIQTRQHYDHENVNLSIDTTVYSHSNQESSKITYSLYDENNQLVYTTNTEVSLTSGYQDISVDLGNLHVKRWMIDDPNLYRLVISIDDQHYSAIRLGFRELTWDDEFIYINGIKTILNGINRHEMDAVTGKTLSDQQIIDDLLLIKENNINAIRLSHYPNDNLTYDVADELGLLLIDEANIESHAGEVELSIPGNNPTYIAEMVDRFSSMVYRDSNHASVIIYSYGNESTYSIYPLDENYGFYVLSQLALQLDDTRLRMYERDNRVGNSRETSMVDIASSQYYSIEEMNKTGNEYNIPYVQQEYAHAMGNALGNFKEYTDAIRENNIAGGFVWDFKDQSIITLIDQTEVYGNGSDWNTVINDGSFCGNGVVSANNVIQDEMLEIRYVYQNFDIAYDNTTNNISIINNYPTLNLNEFMIVIKTIKDKSVDSITYVDNVDASYQETAVVEVNSSNFDVLQVYIVDSNSDDYVSDWIAYQQFVINQPEVSLATINSKDELSIVESENSIDITTNVGSLSINKSNAMISSLIKNDIIYITQGNEINLFRAPMDNDPDINSLIYQEDYDLEVSVKSIDYEDNIAIITLLVNLSEIDVSYELRYTLNSDLDIQVDASIKVGKLKDVGPLTSLGLNLTIPNTFSEYYYYGNGSGDGYIDRNDYGAYGWYEASTVDQPSYFLTPTTTYHKMDVTDLTISSNDGSINFKFDQPLSLMYNQFSPYELFIATHTELMVPSENNTLVLEVVSRGLGNASYGPETLEQYQIEMNTTYTFSYSVNFN